MSKAGDNRSKLLFSLAVEERKFQMRALGEVFFSVLHVRALPTTQRELKNFKILTDANADMCA